MSLSKMTLKDNARIGSPKDSTVLNLGKINRFGHFMTNSNAILLSSETPVSLYPLFSCFKITSYRINYFNRVIGITDNSQYLAESDLFKVQLGM